MSEAPLSSLGKYEIRGTLGKGAMGTVYDGWDPVIHRRVAIKTITLPDANDEEAIEGLARFKREAQAAGRLTHPNIVGVYDYGETDDLAYIVMEFVEGRSLKEVLAARERMTAMDAIALMEDVLAGLTYSHERGVVHRDIKPANIMMTKDDRAKIADFGIARIEASSMTQAGTIMGTPAYMSPEQFMGHVVDRRTDIYSCGVMLYQLLTGERPFDGSMTSIMHKATTTVPPPPSELAVTAPVRLDAVVARAMAKRPEDRYDSAADFATALRAPAPSTAFETDETMVAGPRSASTRPPQPSPSPAGAKRRSKLPIIIGGAVAASVVVAGGVWFLLPSATPRVQEASVAPAPAVPAPPTPAPQPIVPVPASPPNPAPASVVPPAPRTVPPQTASIPPQPVPAAPAVQRLVEQPPGSQHSAPSQQASIAPQPAPARPPPVAVQTPVEPPAPPATVAPRPAPSQQVSVAPPAPAAEPLPSPVVAQPPTPPPTLQASNNAPPITYAAPSAVPPVLRTPVDPAFPASLPPPAPFQSASNTPASDPVPAPLPPPEIKPTRPVALIEATLASSLPAVKCSLARSATAPDGTVTLTGLTGAGQPEDALRRAAVAAGSTGVDWQIRAFNGPYCSALDVLRPVVDFAARNRVGMEMVQSGGPTALQDNDVIALQLKMPGFAGYLHVEYLQNDGTVSPQVPGPGYPAQTYTAHTQLELGTPRQDFEGWHVGPPFGTDMIVAVASTAPLFAKALPDSQPLSAYLNALQTAMDALRRRGGSVAAAAVLLDTRPRQ